MAKIPISILTGFLGSGKTTLLAQILEAHRSQNLAVVVNEWGEVGLDAQVLKHLCFVPERIRLLQGGCVCCHYRQDLIDSLRVIAQEAPDHVILETSGIANPAPILFSLIHDVFLSQHFKVQSVITCLDALLGAQHLEKHTEAQNQIATSSVVVITKTDLQDNFNALSSLVVSINPTALIYDKAKLDPLVLLQENLLTSPIPTPTPHPHFQTLCLELEACLDWSAFTLWLSFLLYRYGDRILRTKGIIQTHEACVALNGVQHIIYPPTHLNHIHGQKPQLVFILKDLNPQDIHNSLQTFLKALGIEFRARVCLSVGPDSQTPAIT
ncbi:CobW family GTP-binding protein [Helicobacter salomonis]|uniref:CobW family GTP-binding protein n=1 Tax=Helicobacter salomonis TaxID=56878 RepID=UPI000CF0A417|nr:GTP-binding protein [Helicobacter salomonis]